MQPSVLLVDKTEGWTSHDHVAAVRRELGRGIKVGHAGTLDPFATGLLVILIGRATRTQRLFMSLDKTYEVRARFGATSTTGDRDGELTTTGRVPVGDLELPVGRIKQTPPAFSAVKVAGRRAYELARAGEAVELAEREVDVHEFTETERDGTDRCFRIRCSSGTYVRSLVADLGDAHCAELRRTAIGPFAVTEASRELAPVPLADALRRFLPELELGDHDAKLISHGRRFPLPDAGDGLAPAAPFIATHQGDLVAVCETDPAGLVRALIGFPSL